MPDQKKPGVVISFDNTNNRTQLKDFSGFIATCSQTQPNQVKMKIEFEITMNGYLKDSVFDPNTTADPDGERSIYLPFDDAANKVINYISLQSMVRVNDADPGDAPVILGFDFSYFGKTRWGKKRWGLNPDFDDLF